MIQSAKDFAIGIVIVFGITFISIAGFAAFFIWMGE